MWYFARSNTIQRKTLFNNRSGNNTYSCPKVKNLKTSSLQNFKKKKIDNNEILIDIKKKYEKLILDIEKYQFSHLKKKLK